MNNTLKNILIGLTIFIACCCILIPPIGILLLANTIKTAIPTTIIYGLYLIIKKHKTAEEKTIAEVHTELNEIEKSMLQQEKINRINAELNEIEENLNDRIQKETSTDKVTWIWDNPQGKP